jgi:hypothetical protein
VAIGTEHHCRERLSKAIPQQPGFGGASVTGVSASFLGLSVSYSGSGLRSQEGTSPLYFSPVTSAGNPSRRLERSSMQPEHTRGRITAAAAAGLALLIIALNALAPSPSATARDIAMTVLAASTLAFLVLLK